MRKSLYPNHISKNERRPGPAWKQLCRLKPIVILNCERLTLIFGLKKLPGHHLNRRLRGLENIVPPFINDKTNVYVPLKWRQDTNPYHLSHKFVFHALTIVHIRSESPTLEVEVRIQDSQPGSVEIWNRISEGHLPAQF